MDCDVVFFGDGVEGFFWLYGVGYGVLGGFCVVIGWGVYVDCCACF